MTVSRVRFRSYARFSSWAMRPGFSDEYRPDMERHAIYDYLYARYLKLGAAR